MLEGRRQLKEKKVRWAWLLLGSCYDLSVQLPQGLTIATRSKNVKGHQHEEEDELTELEERLKAAKLPDHAQKVAQKELKVSKIWRKCGFLNGLRKCSVGEGTSGTVDRTMKVPLEPSIEL